MDTTPNTFKKILFTALLLCSMLPATTTYAVDPPESYTLLEPLPCITGTETGCTNGTIKVVQIDQYVTYAFNLFIALAAVAAVFMISWGGFLYMTSDAVGVKGEGLKKAQNAVYGLLLVLCAYLILKTINPQLVAIPPNLVPKLQIDAGKLQYNTFFFNSLAADMDRYANQSDTFNSNFTAARQTANDAEKKKKELLDQLDYLEYDLQLPDTDPEIQKIKAQISAVDNTLVTAKGRGVVEASKASMAGSGLVLTQNKISGLNDRIFETTRTDEIDKIIADGKKIVSDIRTINNKKLTELGAIDQIKDVNDYANYSELALDLLRHAAAMETVSVVPSLGGENVARYTNGNKESVLLAKPRSLAELQVISSKLGNVQDPTLRAELQVKIDRQTAAANIKFAPKQ